MGDCSFCKEFKSYLECAEQMMKDGYRCSYTAALVETMTYDGSKSNGRTVAYKHDGVGFPLNFCPECGKKLAGESHG